MTNLPPPLPITPKEMEKKAAMHRCMAGGRPTPTLSPQDRSKPPQQTHASMKAAP